MQRRSFLAWLGLAPAAAVAPAPAMGATPFDAMLRAPRAVGLAAALQAPYLVGEAVHVAPMIEGQALAPMASHIEIDQDMLRSITRAELRRHGIDAPDGDDMQLTEGAGI